MTPDVITEPETVPKEAEPNLLAGWISRDQLARELGITRGTLARWEARQDGPPCTRIGRKAFYRCASVQSWIRAMSLRWSMMGGRSITAFYPSPMPGRAASKLFVRIGELTICPPGAPRPSSLTKAVAFGTPEIVFLDLPQLTEAQSAHQPLIAAHAKPWPGEMAVFRSPSTDGFEFLTSFSSRARIGTLVSDLYSGPTSRFDHGNALVVELLSGIPWNWRIGPANRPVSDDSYVAQNFTPEAVGLRPFSVAHVEQPWRRPRTPGDLTIRWIRRSRALSADSWGAMEVPLAEYLEAYEVEVLDGSAVKRVLSANTASVIYSAAQQTADWGGLPGPGDTLNIRIFQLSNMVGRGAPKIATLQF